MTNRWLMTRGKLERALARVQKELIRHGFWQEPIAAVETELFPIAVVHGYYVGRGAGTILVPAISFSRSWEIITGRYGGIGDVIRHEFGHAICRCCPRPFKSRRFASVFGGDIHSGQAFEYDPDLHVSKYAATNPEEWFCESLMYYLKFAGRLPRQWRRTPLALQWSFIEDLPRAMRARTS